MKLKIESNHNPSFQQEASVRQSRLEEEQRTLADALTAAERRANEERSRCLQNRHISKMNP